MFQVSLEAYISSVLIRYLYLKCLIIIIIITLFQEGDIYITIVNHDGPQNNRNNITMQKITLKI